MVVVVFFFAPEEDLAVVVRFDALAVFLLPEVFGATFLCEDFAPLVVLRVFAAVDFEPPVDRPPPVVFFLEDEADAFLLDDPAPEVFLEDDPAPEAFLEDDAEVFLEDEPPVDAFFEVDRALEAGFRAVELPPDLAPPDVVFLDAEDVALDDVPFFAEDPVEPDAFLAVVFLGGDFLAVDAVFDFDPAFAVDFDEVDFLAEVFDEVFFVVAIGPPVIKVSEVEFSKIKITRVKKNARIILHTGIDRRAPRFRHTK